MCFILYLISSFISTSNLINHKKFIHSSASLLETIKVPAFADSVSEGDVR